MIACVNPAYSSANHTINTLRYSDRLKEKTSMMNKNINSKEVNFANNVNNNIVNNNFNANANANIQNVNKLYNNNGNGSRHSAPHNNLNNNFKEVNIQNKIKEIDDINMHVFNMKEDNINDIDFDDRMNVCDDRFNTRI